MFHPGPLYIFVSNLNPIFKVINELFSIIKICLNYRGDLNSSDGSTKDIEYEEYVGEISLGSTWLKSNDKYLLYIKKFGLESVDSLIISRLSSVMHQHHSI